MTKQGQQSGGVGSGYERSSSNALGDLSKDIERTRQLRLPAVIARKETDKMLRSKLSNPMQESFRSIDFEKKDSIL